MPVQNNCNFIGYVTKEIEQKRIGDKTVVNFSLGLVPENRKKDDETTYADFSAWSQTAENIVKTTSKGDKLSVQCKYSKKKSKDPNSEGKYTYYHSFLVESFQNHTSIGGRKSDHVFEQQAIPDQNEHLADTTW